MLLKQPRVGTRRPPKKLKKKEKKGTPLPLWIVCIE
jgi:hypothetical protein